MSACTLFRNSAEGFGGGIYNNASGSFNNNPIAELSLSDCTISDNFANFGGGIYSRGFVGTATLSLDSSTLSKNSASSSGGGIYSSGSLGSAELSLSTCTLSGNSADSDGGGIYSTGSSGSTEVNLDACTLSGNFAGDNGGGVYNLDGFQGNAELSLSDTILAGNTATTGTGPDLWEGSGATITTAGNNLLSSIAGSNTSNPPPATITIVSDPILAPLGNYGGPTLTMHPLAGSPAIISSNVLVRRTDQRGFRFGGPKTIGAVKVGPATKVTNTNDNGVGSLRAALEASVNTIGVGICFEQNLSGGTITLSSGQLEVPGSAQALFVDASDLPDGITINANGSTTGHRVLEIQPGASATLNGIELTGGAASGSSFPDDRGGAIYNNNASLNLNACHLSANSATTSGGGIYSNGADDNIATLSLRSCSLSSNSARFGGGIFSDGREDGSATLSLIACTLFNNAASIGGGGIYSNGFTGNAAASLTACTLFGNSATSDGGGILSTGATIFGSGNTGYAELNLTSCTLSGNSAGGSGGGVHSAASNGSAVLRLSDTILAGNTAPTGSDLRENAPNAITSAIGNNLLTSIAGSNISNSPPVEITLVSDPLLAPLADYGGPTLTMLPLRGSPAILNTPDITRTDQRGFTFTGPKTIGAVKLPPATKVTNTNDNGNGSLRDALENSVDTFGALICFEPNLSGNTIILSSGQLEIPGSAQLLTVDATDLPSGITIDANGATTGHRVMEIQAGAIATLNGIDLTGGVASGSFPDDRGGAIYNNNATLSLNDCGLSGNSASSNGGAIHNIACPNGEATLFLSACTLSGNSAAFSGGAISNSGIGGSASLSACTLSGNSACIGGGINNLSGADLNLSSCTLSGNSATRLGGGIFTNGGSSPSIGLVTLHDTILAGNTAVLGGSDSWENGENAITSAIGNNLMSVISGTNISNPPPAEITLVSDPMLTPLGDYGGPTMTMLPLPGSPAIEKALTSTRTNDQRGQAVNGISDIGATEFQGVDDYPNIAPHVWDIDYDDDGIPFGVEFTLGTDPFTSDPNHPGNLCLSINAANEPVLDFGYNPDAVGISRWVLEGTPILPVPNGWITLDSSDDPGAASSFTAGPSITGQNGEERYFFRFRAELINP